jgi:hypothetical protein
MRTAVNRVFAIVLEKLTLLSVECETAMRDSIHEAPYDSPKERIGRPVKVR